MELVLNSLKDILEVEKEAFDDKKSFFSILGRTYDEDLISRVISYVLKKDKKLIKNLIKKYTEEKCDSVFLLENLDKIEVNVCPEKMMGIGRADIFIELTYKNLVVATITIENKIWSWEHSHQTQTYYDWVIKQTKYSESLNAFYYLRPEFNHSKAECDRYINITYDVLCDMIELDDYITEDFKNHSKLFLREKNMNYTEDQLYLIEKYDDIQRILKETLDVYQTRQNNLIERIKEKFQYTQDILFEVKNAGIGIGSFRLYKNEWYKKDEYYFFVEVKFIDGKLNHIQYQKVAKDYQNKKDKTSVPAVVCFVEGSESYGHYHVLEREEYSSQKEWTSKEWEDKFVKESVKKLEEYVNDMDEKVAQFLAFQG